MKRALFLAATLLTALAPVIALAAAVQSNLAITVTSPPPTPPPPPPSPGGGGSLLPADRDASANWRMAGLQSVGGIPNRTTQCGATVSPRGSGLDDTTNIRNAINACPVGQVVQLAAGTFTVVEGNYVQIVKGITVRGAGPGQTIFRRTGGASIGVSAGSAPTPHFLLASDRWTNNFATTAKLTADAAQGAMSVQVASTTGFSVGQIVLLDEASNMGWQPDWVYGGQVWAAPDYRLFFPIHNPAQSGDEGSPQCWFLQECDRYTNEIKQIASINVPTNTITFDSPVTISYRVSHAAHLVNYQTPFTAYAGVENLTLMNGDDSNLVMRWCAYCWVKNVETTIHAGDGIRVSEGFRDQIEGVYDHQGSWPYTGGAGYNLVFNNGSSEFLLENSISILNDKVMVVRASGAGSVVAYNYMDMGWCHNCTGSWVETGMNASHWLGSHHVLFEGNWTFNMDSDSTWGESPYITWFRNYGSGYRSRFTDYIDNSVWDDINQRNGPYRGASTMTYTYWHSFIGNVLGTPGHASGWAYDSSGGPSIYMLGYNPLSWNKPDTEVANHTHAACVSATGDPCSAIRDGNYNYLNNAIIWASNDTAHTLPNSLYLPGKPAFFTGTASTWPWVNPTGTPQLYTNPAKARYDAGTPLTQP